MENVISWTIPNWITIVLMVAIGFLILGGAAHFVRAQMGPADDSGS